MQHPILVLNCGSSSIKFAIVDPNTGKTALTGLAENLANADAQLSFKSAGEKRIQALPANADHESALDVIQTIIKQQPFVPVAVGHRVVHGGETFKQAARVNDDVKQAISDCAEMAPLHNPANLMGIESAQHAFPNLPHVAVFDTSFFQTMPNYAYLYALPKSLYEEHGIRRYGFHGSSHQFVSKAAAQMLEQKLEETSLITAHLGNGCSITAIRDGVAVDTSLGFTPLEGLVMGTRCGDLDPSLPGILSRQLKMNMGEIDALLNKSSGLLGISGLSNDCRTLEDAAQNGDKHAQLALQIFCYRLAKYIGAYLVVTGPLDALVFTGGIGENSEFIRRTTCDMLAHLGFTLDDKANLDARFGQSGNIAAGDIPIFVIPTNEEWVIAQETQRLCNLSD